ncbi:MAG TPA: Dabb family protein [Fibrobacteria bacterium]|nr:Dabb family protein [Fibrobacteria bacterium]
MFIHSVYFWLKPGLSPENVKTFETLSNAMAGIPGVGHLWVGKPAPTDRPVIDRSYSYALTVVFKDMAAHDAYQKHPIHDTFRNTCGDFWSQVKIYDSL